jgi:hypothetical protein
MDSSENIVEHLLNSDLAVLYTRGEIASQMCCVCNKEYIGPDLERVTFESLEDTDTFAMLVHNTQALKGNGPDAVCIYSRYDPIYNQDQSVAKVLLLCKSTKSKVPRLGAMMLYAVCYALRDAGVHTIKLNISRDPTALRLYASVGFVPLPANNNVMVLDTSAILPFGHSVQRPTPSTGGGKHIRGGASTIKRSTF